MLEKLPRSRGELLEKIRGKRLRLLSATYGHFFARILDSESISMVSTKETMELIMDRLKKQLPTILLRFGDGEINILHGYTARHQGPSAQLQKEFKEAFQLHGSDVIKCAPLHSDLFGREEEMRDGEHLQTDERARELVAMCFQHFVGSPIYSPVAVHYSIAYDPEKFIELMHEVGSYSPVFVGSERNDAEVVNSLLNTRQIVETPHTNAYTEIDAICSRINNELDKRNRDFDVVVFSCGPSAKIMQKRLYRERKNLFLFDLGSVIDVFHGRKRWTWVRRIDERMGRAYWDDMLKRIEQGHSVDQQMTAP